MNDFFSNLNNQIMSLGFSGAILISSKWNVLYKQAFRFANIEFDVENQVSTVFRIASVSKQITAAAILFLVEEGRLSLEDNVKKFIPDFPSGERITIHHILSNSSGIANFDLYADFYEALHQSNPLLGLINVFKHLPLRFEPGTQFEYSNSGYLLLSYFIEVISGLNYEEYLKTTFFDKLYMNSTGFDFYQRIVKNRARGYDLMDGTLINAWFIDMQIAGGGGALYSTVEDIHRWNKALYHGKVIREEILQKMFSPNIKIMESTDYGYGIFLAKEMICGKLRRKYYHTGGGPGVRSINTIYPDDDIEVIILSNVNDNNVFSQVEIEVERFVLENRESLDNTTKIS